MSENKANKKDVQIVFSRQWFRLVVAYLLVPFILLICSGDFGWWQAWLYSILILLSGIGGRIWSEQRHPGLTAERQDKEIFENAKAWDKILAPLMAVSIVFLMAIIVGLDHRFSWTPEYLLWLSVVCIQMNRGQKVCDSGPYRFVRHLGYAGNILPLIGIVLTLGSVWTLIPAGAALIITVIRTALEDRTLHEELPGYRDYEKRVRYRLIPSVY